MAANVETMFSVREKPWHGMGTIISEAPTSADAIRLAGLDWEVEGKPVFTDSGMLIPNYKANIRSSDNSVLGIVTDRYQVVQNREAFEFTDSLISEGNVKYETAGSLSGGKRIWMLARMPETKILDDEVEPYICFTNSHDGFGAIKVCMTPVRVVCQNTLNLALERTKRCWSTKHVGDINSKLEEAKYTLGMANSYMDSLKEEADRLAHTKMDNDEIAKILSEMFPVTEDMTDRRKQNIENAKESFYTCYYMPDIAKFMGTQYGFINAMADFTQHIAPARKSDSYKENNFARIVVDGHPIFDNAYKAILARA